MPQSFTPVVPVTNADVAANLLPQLPLGSETRLVTGLYSACQKMLNMAAAVAIWWQGGSLGDPVNIGDNSKRVQVFNPIVFKSALDVEDADLSAVNVNALDAVSANTLVHSYQDMTADRDLTVGRNANVGGSFGVTGGAAVGGAFGVGGAAAIAGAFTAAVGSSLVGAVSALNAANKIAGKHIDAAVLGSDANTTYPILSTDLVVIPDGSSILTADRVYTIDPTGASNGMSCTFSNQSTTHKITLMGLPAHAGGFDLKAASGICNELTVIVIGGVVYAYAPCITS